MENDSLNAATVAPQQSIADKQILRDLNTTTERQLSDELFRTRQTPILAAAAFLVLWWVVLLLQSLFNGKSWTGIVVVIGCLGVAFAILNFKKRIHFTTLKLIELTMFAIMVAYFVSTCLILES